MKFSDFIRPASLDEARSLLRDLGPKGLPVAGGTGLQFMQDHKSLVAVDITGLSLSSIRHEGDHFIIGATTPLSEIQRYRAPRWAMHEICRRISTHQIRNISTIGGNIARVFPWADMPVVLLAMDASVVIRSDRDLEFSADEYFERQPLRYFKDGSLLTAVKVPDLKVLQGFGSVKAVRNMASFSMVTIATRLDFEGEYITSARVAGGSAVPFPIRLPSVEAALIGKEPSPQVFREAAALAGNDANWSAKEGMSAEYSRELAQVSIVDALERAAAFAKERVE